MLEFTDCLVADIGIFDAKVPKLFQVGKLFQTIVTDFCTVEQKYFQVLKTGNPRTSCFRDFRPGQIQSQEFNSGQTLDVFITDCHVAQAELLQTFDLA